MHAHVCGLARTTCNFKLNVVRAKIHVERARPHTCACIHTTSYNAIIEKVKISTH